MELYLIDKHTFAAEETDKYLDAGTKLKLEVGLLMRYINYTTFNDSDRLLPAYKQMYSQLISEGSHFIIIGSENFGSTLYQVDFMTTFQLVNGKAHLIEVFSKNKLGLFAAYSNVDKYAHSLNSPYRVIKIHKEPLFYYSTKESFLQSE